MNSKGASHLTILMILSTLMAFASISTDLYLPALPIMQHALHSNSGAIEWTISGFLIGFSISQLFWGPISDRYGRKRPIAMGLLFFIIGSTGCALSTDISAMIFWRAVQAIGACASVVLARAIVRDLYEGPRAAKMLSTLITVMAIAPLVGPSVGGMILHVSSWRTIFWTLVGVGVLTLMALGFLPESLPESERKTDSLGRLFSHYGELLRHRHLMAYIGVGAFFYGGVYAYIAGTPFAYITYYHISPQIYGLLFALGIIGIMVTNQINIHLIGINKERLLHVGVYLVATASIFLIVDAWTGWGGLAGLVIPLFLFVSANGFIVANSISGALSFFPQSAGSASALLGSLQYGAGIISTALVGVFADGTPLPMAWIMALCAAGSILCLVVLRHENFKSQIVGSTW